MDGWGKAGKIGAGVLLVGGIGWVVFEVLFLHGKVIAEREVSMAAEPEQLEIERAGETLTLEAHWGSRRERRVAVELVGPGGEVIVSRPGLRERKSPLLIDFEPPKPGTYELTLRAHTLVGTGHADVEILTEDKRVLTKLLDII